MIVCVSVTLIYGVLLKVIQRVKRHPFRALEGGG
jgi:hypothetical protein